MLAEAQIVPRMMEDVEKGDSKTLAVVAALNEEEGIGHTLAEINDCLYSSLCLVVDGRSTDKTVKVARTMGAEVIFQKGSGKGDAIATAIAHVNNLDVDYVAFIDADFTYPAGYLPEMIRILDEKPDVGMVCGNRFNNHVHLGKMHNILYTGNRALALMHSLLNGVNMCDPLTGLRVVRWKLLRDWKPKSQGFDVEVELNYYIERKGYDITEIPINYRPRLGDKKLHIKHGLTIMKRILDFEHF
jgi:glycosyltransferase involved in cell wall biosynthesis